MRLTRNVTKEVLPTRARSLPALAVTATVGLAVAFGSLSTGQASPAASPPANAQAQPGRCHQPGPYQLPHGGERVDLDPADFSHRITNPYWPMRPGTTWTFREGRGAGEQRVRLTVLDRTRLVRGIKARIIHDVVRVKGEIIENTFDWYAQDSGGSVWYLGEFSREYENGVPVSTEGSWEYGVDGAQAGVVVPARLRPGCRYRQEFLAGEAEDYAAILSIREDLHLPVGRFADVLTTGDYVGLEPGVVEHKFFARGVGPVLSLHVSPTGGREILVAHSPAG